MGILDVFSNLLDSRSHIPTEGSAVGNSMAWDSYIFCSCMVVVLQCEMVAFNLESSWI